MAWPASSAARRFRSPGGARSASLSPGLASPVPQPRQSCAPASSVRGRGFVVRGGEASRVDGEGDVREGLGEREGVDPDFPDVVPGADVEGRGDGLPCGTAVCGGEFEGDAADAGGPLSDAQLAGTRGHVTATLTAHMHDAGTDPRLRRPARPASSPVPCPPYRASPSAHQSPIAPPLPRPCFRPLLHPLWAAVWDTAGREESASYVPIERSSYPRARIRRCARLNSGAGIPPELVVK